MKLAIVAALLSFHLSAWADVMCGGQSVTAAQIAAQVTKVLNGKCAAFKGEPCEKADPKAPCRFASDAWTEIKAGLPKVIDYKVFDVRKGGLCTKSWEVHMECSCQGSTKLLKPNLVLSCSRPDLGRVVCTKK